MRNSIYQSLSDSDKEKIQNNIKEYPCSGGILYNELNNNYYVTKISVGTLLDLSSVLKIKQYLVFEILKSVVLIPSSLLL